jgi:hypothetical protein
MSNVKCHFWCAKISILKTFLEAQTTNYATQ